MQDQQDLLFENLYEFVSMLLAEIIGSPDLQSSAEAPGSVP